MRCFSETQRAASINLLSGSGDPDRSTYVDNYWRPAVSRRSSAWWIGCRGGTVSRPLYYKRRISVGGLRCFSETQRADSINLLSGSGDPDRSTYVDNYWRPAVSLLSGSGDPDRSTYEDIIGDLRSADDLVLSGLDVSPLYYKRRISVGWVEVFFRNPTGCFNQPPVWVRRPRQINIAGMWSGLLT